MPTMPTMTIHRTFYGHGEPHYRASPPAPPRLPGEHRAQPMTERYPASPVACGEISNIAPLDHALKINPRTINGHEGRIVAQILIGLGIVVACVGWLFLLGGVDIDRVVNMHKLAIANNVILLGYVLAVAGLIVQLPTLLGIAPTAKEASSTETNPDPSAS
jgi:hypothetical protein